MHSYALCTCCCVLPSGSIATRAARLLPHGNVPGFTVLGMRYSIDTEQTTRRWGIRESVNVRSVLVGVGSLAMLTQHNRIEHPFGQRRHCRENLGPGLTDRNHTIPLLHTKLRATGLGVHKLWAVRCMAAKTPGRSAKITADSRVLIRLHTAVSGRYLYVYCLCTPEHWLCVAHRSDPLSHEHAITFRTKAAEDGELQHAGTFNPVESKTATQGFAWCSLQGVQLSRHTASHDMQARHKNEREAALHTEYKPHLAVGTLLQG